MVDYLGRIDFEFKYTYKIGSIYNDWVTIKANTDNALEYAEKYFGERFIRYSQYLLEQENFFKFKESLPKTFTSIIS